MPLGDRTGPAGKVPKTGRGLGYCAGYSSPGYKKSGRGRRAPAGQSRSNRKRTFLHGSGILNGNDVLRKVGAL